MKLLAFLALLAPASLSAAITYTGSWSVTTAIPDNDSVGFSDKRDLGIPADSQVVGVTVDLTFTGGWNGDLYAYLVHDGGFTVLLNRVGRSLTSPDGSASSGLSITVSDSAPSDIHTTIPMGGGVVSGTYQPDGRATDPAGTLNTDPRTAMLASFDGLEGGGLWTLFVADQSPGDTSTLQSWGLSVTVVPEPGYAALAAVGLMGLLLRRRVPAGN